MQLDPSSFRCPYIRKEEIWEFADEFRSKYCHRDILPIDVESTIEKSLALDIVPQHGLLADFDIDAWLKMDLTGIVVDHKCYMEDRFANRLRFSYAHELGHLILHKDLYLHYNLDTIKDWIWFIHNLPEREYGLIEYHANEFAGRLLVPRDNLICELNKCYQQIQTFGLVDQLKYDSSAVLSRISPTLCRPFGVSTSVIERRVDREGLWPPRDTLDSNNS